MTAMNTNSRRALSAPADDLPPVAPGLPHGGGEKPFIGPPGAPFETLLKQLTSALVATGTEAGADERIGEHFELRPAATHSDELLGALVQQVGAGVELPHAKAATASAMIGRTSPAGTLPAARLERNRLAQRSTASASPQPPSARAT